MVADTNTLLNKESRKALQLLQGLKGTHLIIPRMGNEILSGPHISLTLPEYDIVVQLILIIAIAFISISYTGTGLLETAWQPVYKKNRGSGMD